MPEEVHVQLKLMVETVFGIASYVVKILCRVRYHTVNVALVLLSCAIWTLYFIFVILYHFGFTPLKTWLNRFLV